MKTVHIAVLVTWLFAGCAPQACSNEDEDMARDLRVMLGDSDQAADAAEERLVSRGRAAIVILESGLYQAEPAGRRRIVRALVRIGNPEAVPILEHLAARDPDERVRKDAKDAIPGLSSP